jgi:hypothetical protein
MDTIDEGLEEKYIEIVGELIDSICAEDSKLMQLHISAMETFKSGIEQDRLNALNAVFARKIELLTTHLRGINDSRRRN